MTITGLSLAFPVAMETQGQTPPLLHRWVVQFSVVSLSVCHPYCDSHTVPLSTHFSLSLSVYLTVSCFIHSHFFFMSLCSSLSLDLFGASMWQSSESLALVQLVRSECRASMLELFANVHSTAHTPAWVTWFNYMGNFREKIFIIKYLTQGQNYHNLEKLFPPFSPSLSFQHNTGQTKCGWALWEARQAVMTIHGCISTRQSVGALIQMLFWTILPSQENRCPGVLC